MFLWRPAISSFKCPKKSGQQGSTRHLKVRTLKVKPDVVWAVLGKVIQSNARFGLSDRLEVHLDHVRMPVGNGKKAEKTKGR